MRIVQTWAETDLADKEIRSSDNKEVGHARKGDGPFLLSVKGMKTYSIPRDAVATFDGDKVYLRATEAEVAAGVYPFLREVDCDCGCHSEHVSSQTAEPTKVI